MSARSFDASVRPTHCEFLDPLKTEIIHRLLAADVAQLVEQRIRNA